MKSVIVHRKAQEGKDPEALARIINHYKRELDRLIRIIKEDKKTERI